jgi:autotransporter translocation and assembly factor TamB
VEASLNWGSGTLEAAGALGDPADALRLVVDLPKVDDVVDSLSGSVKGEATLRGGLKDPAVEASLDGNRLVATSDGLRTTIVAATLQLKSAGVRSGLLNLQSRLDEVAVVRVATGGYAMSAAAGGLLRFDQVNAAVDGSQAGHDFDLVAAGKDQHLTLSASGGLSGDGLWRGVVNRFAASHPLLKMPGRGELGGDAAGGLNDALVVAAPVDASVSAPIGTSASASISASASMSASIPGSASTADLGSSGVAPDHLHSLQPFAVTAGTGRLSARGASFDFQGALLDLKQADWRESVLTLSADASAVPARWVGRFMSPEALDWRSFSTDAAVAAVDGSVPHDLRLAATVHFSGNLADTSAAAWRGSLEVRRERGDVWLEGPEAPARPALAFGRCRRARCSIPAILPCW